MVLLKLRAGEWGEDRTPALYTVEKELATPDIAVDIQLPSQADQTHAQRVTQKIYTHPSTESSLSQPQSHSLTPGKQLPAFKGRMFLVLGNTTDQQALELRQQTAKVLCSSLPPRHTAITQDTVVIANQQAMADPLYWQTQALGCKMLDADALSAVLQQPSTMLNFLSAMPGNPATSLPPRGTAEDDSGPPETNTPRHDLALQQQEYNTCDSLAPVDWSLLPGKASLQHPQQHHPDSAGLDITSLQLQQDADCSTLASCSGELYGGQAMDKPLSGQTFVFLGSSKVIGYKDKFFTVQHWQQQLQQLGATVVTPQSFIAAALNRAPGSVAGVTGETPVRVSSSAGCRGVIVVLTDPNTEACSAYQVAELLGCRMLDVEGLYNLLNDCMQLQNLLRIMMPAASNAVHAAVTAAAEQTRSSPAVQPGGVASADMPGHPNGSFRLGSAELSLVPPSASPTVQQAAALQIGKPKGTPKHQAVHYQLDTSTALQGKTFMFVGKVKKRDGLIGKLKSHGAQLVQVPNQGRLGTGVILVAGAGAAITPQYAAAYELGCRMLRARWLKTVLADPGKLNSLLEDMAAPCVMMAPAKPAVQAQQQHVEQKQKHATSLNGAQAAPVVDDKAEQKQQQHRGEYKPPAEARDYKAEANMHTHRDKKVEPKHLQQQVAAIAADAAGLNAPHSRVAAYEAKVMVVAGGVSSDSEASDGTEWVNKYAAIYCSQESALGA